jgi:hypothetical protein
MGGMANYIFSVLFACSAGFHPIHVSVLNIDYAKGNPSIELAFKIFTSDFELAIAHNYNAVMNLGKTNENPDNIKHIDKYFSYIFAIEVNEHDPSKLVYTKKETNESEDATWFYFKVPVHRKVKELLIRNQLLFDIYEDQTNLVILNINGKESGYRFNYSKREIKIKI